MLDRVTTAASDGPRSARAAAAAQRRPPPGRCSALRRRIALASSCSRHLPLGGNVPGDPRWAPDRERLDYGRQLDRRPPLDGSPGSKNAVTNGVLNPLQNLLSDSPWWLARWRCWRRAASSAGAGPVADADLPGRHHLHWTCGTSRCRRCLDPGRRPRRDGPGRGPRRLDGAQPPGRPVMRPVLDAGQTMPAFVYLIPALALFGADPLHRDRRRGRLRRAGRDQARRRRHPRRAADDDRGGRARPVDHAGR